MTLSEMLAAGEITLSDLIPEEWAQVSAEWEADVLGGYANSRLRPSPAREWSKPPRWLVHGLIPEVGVGQIYGASGSGKTYLALDLALSVANAREFWFGHRIRRTGAVVYVAMEGSWSLQNRIAAWMQGNGGSDVRLFTLEEEALNLADRESVAQLGSDILNADLYYEPLRPVLIVFDTQRLSFQGDENATEPVTAMMRNVIDFAGLLNCACILVHHEGYSDVHARGSTAVKDALAFQFHVKKDKKASGVRGELLLEKNKYGETPPEGEPIAGYEVVYNDLHPFNKAAHDFDAEVVLDAYGEPLRDGYLIEAPLKSKSEKAADAVRALKIEPTPEELVRELFTTCGKSELTKGTIRSVLGGNSPQSQARFKALEADGVLVIAESSDARCKLYRLTGAP